MAFEQGVPSTPFAEAVLSHSADFMMLGHSLAFEQVLLDNLVKREDKLTLDRLNVPRFLMSGEMVEAHDWPADFSIEGLEAVVTEQPETDDCDEVWMFSASYKVNGQAYTMNATPDGVTSTFYDINGNPNTRTYRPGVGTSFLQTIARAILLEKGFLLSHNIPDDFRERPEALRLIFKSIGNLAGEYSAILDAHVQDPEKPDKGLLVKFTEKESPSESEIDLDFSMLWRVGDEGTTIVRSNHQEGNVDIEAGKYWHVVFASRKPTSLGPEDLPFGMALEMIDEDEESAVKLFMPIDSGLNYEIVNTSIVTMLYPYLEKYKHLDEEPVENVDEAYIPEQLA